MNTPGWVHTRDPRPCTLVINPALPPALAGYLYREIREDLRERRRWAFQVARVITAWTLVAGPLVYALSGRFSITIPVAAIGAGMSLAGMCLLYDEPKTTRERHGDQVRRVTTEQGLLADRLLAMSPESREAIHQAIWNTATGDPLAVPLDELARALEANQEVTA